MEFYFHKIGRLSKQHIKIQIPKSQNILKIRDNSKNTKGTYDIICGIGGVILFSKPFP